MRWTIVLCSLLFAATAQAAIRIGSAPAGWASEASPEASARAAEWAELTDGRVAEVFSTKTGDSFTETIAILTLPGAIAPNADLDPEAALVDAVGGMFETAPSDPRYLEESGEAPIVIGTWDEDDVTYQVAVASAGPNRGAVIFAYRTAERSLYAQDFDALVEGISGTSPPLAPFDVGRWRIGAVIGWLALSVLGWVAIANTARGRDGAAAVGRGVAMLAILMAVVAAVGTYVALRGDAAQLQLAGSSRFAVATEVAAGGILVALVAWFIGALRDSTVRRVQSAPKGGTFSGASMRTLTNNLVPPTRPAALTDPGHGMTPEDLDRADLEAVSARQPKATLVGTPSLASATSSDAAFDEVWAKAQAAIDSGDDFLDADVGDMPTTEMARPNFEVPDEVVNPPRPEPKASAGTIVGPAPGPEAPKPKTTPKTKTAALQFPPPMSDGEN